MADSTFTAWIDGERSPYTLRYRFAPTQDVHEVYLPTLNCAFCDKAMTLEELALDAEALRALAFEDRTPMCLQCREMAGEMASEWNERQKQ